MTGALRKSVLVAGGAGFLGTHLCRHLLEAGCRVICVDNFSSGSRRNLDQLSEFEGFSCIEHDIEEPLSVEAVEVIYNLASVASPVQYQQHPLAALRTSAIGTDNLLKLALRFNARLFQASTSEVYGDPLAHPQHEDYCGNVNPVGPRACYDEGKRYAESLCMDYHRVHNVDVRIARIFNTYGPYMQIDDGRVVSNFIVQALQNHPITINGDGGQTRSFCYVDDMIRGIVALTTNAEPLPMPINIGNPNELSVLDLAHLILDLTGSSSSLVFQGLPQDDPTRRQPDISRAKQFLDWEPTVELSDGLSKTIAYFDDLLMKGQLEMGVVNKTKLLSTGNRKAAS